MKLELLAQYLDDEDVARQGRDLFVHFMPEEVTEGVMLKARFQPTERMIDLPDYYKTGFQVIIRASNYIDGNAMADRVSSVLTLGQITMGDEDEYQQLFRYIRPLHQPIVYPLSRADLLEFSVNFETVFVECQPISTD